MKPKTLKNIILMRFNKKNIQKYPKSDIAIGTMHPKTSSRTYLNKLRAADPRAVQVH